jgi:hypothetical protein
MGRNNRLMCMGSCGVVLLEASGGGLSCSARYQGIVVELSIISKYLNFVILRLEHAALALPKVPV